MHILHYTYLNIVYYIHNRCIFVYYKYFTLKIDVLQLEKIIFCYLFDDFSPLFSMVTISGTH